MTRAARAARIEAIFRPYHDRIAAALDRRAAEGRASVLVALHSFTPVFRGVSRPWHVGVLFNRDARLAHPLLGLLRAEGDLTVGENEPYRVTDLTDYTVPVHGERRGLPHVEIEIRQDLIARARGPGRLGRAPGAPLTRRLRRIPARLNLPRTAAICGRRAVTRNTVDGSTIPPSLAWAAKASSISRRIVSTRRRIGLLLVDQPAGGAHDAGVLGLLFRRRGEDAGGFAVDLDALEPGRAEERAHVIGVAERHRPRRAGGLWLRRPQMAQGHPIRDQPMLVMRQAGPSRRSTAGRRAAPRPADW